MEEIAKVKILTLEANAFGRQMQLNPVLIWDNSGATLVDAMIPGCFELIKGAVEAAGVPFSQLKRIILTHQDWDHIGSVPDIIAALGGQVEICAHVQEKPYLEGALRYIKMTPERIAERIKTVPEELQATAAATFANLPTFPVTRPLEDGDTLPIAGGLEVIHTPGHTPGHISLLLKSHRTLISGDALLLENGVLVGPSPIHSTDLAQAYRSLNKLVGRDIDYVICYHGGLYGPNASPRIAELAAGV